MSTSVVMVTYHTGPIVSATIKTVLRQQELAELIVVDNGNSPVVLTRLQQMALTETRLRIVTGHGNVGFAGGCNLGAKQATGDYLLLLHPDCLLPPNALVETAQVLANTPGALLAGCHLENPEGKEIFTPPLGEITSIPGAFMFVKRSDYERLFGLDEDFFVEGANLDFCMRVRNSGGKIIRAENVRVTRVGGTRPAVWREFKGLRCYLGKHFRKKYVPFLPAMVEPMPMLRFTYAFLKAVAMRKPGHGKAARRFMLLASGLVELPENHLMEGKIVLVTGATGQVGLCVVRRLIAAGAKVIGLSRGDGIPFRHEQLRWVTGDLLDKNLKLGFTVDIVVHCAPLWHLPSAMNALMGTDARRIIAFGSTSIFAKALSKNDYEKDLVKNLARAEAELTERCKAGGIHLTIFRPTLIYGVGLDGNVTTLAKFIRRFGFFPVYPPAFGRRQPVHADDLALAVLQVVEKENTYGKAYNVSGGEIVTYREMLERLFKLFDLKIRIVPTTLFPFALDVIGKVLRKKDLNGEIARRMNDDLIFFHDEASHDFHFAPRTFLTGGIRDIEG